MPALLDEDDKGPTTFVIQDNGLLTSLDTVLDAGDGQVQPPHDQYEFFP